MLNFLALNVSMAMIIVWAIVLVATLIIEFETANLVSIWFSAGALAAIVANLFGLDAWIQIIIFVVISAIFVIATRPFVKKMSDNQTIPTNSDRLIGMTAIVTKEIPEDEKGEVKAEFQKWPAISKNNKSFSVGEKVLIVEISGNKLVVEELHEVEIN